VLSTAASSEPFPLVFSINLLPRHSFGAEIIIDLVLVFFFVIFFSNSLFFVPFLDGLLGRLLVIFGVFRQSIGDVVLDFVQDIRVSLDAVFVVIDVVFLSLAGPRMFADHIHVGLSGFFEPLVFFKRVLFKSV